jgi:hypothetical protein
MDRRRKWWSPCFYSLLPAIDYLFSKHNPAFKFPSILRQT